MQLCTWTFQIKCVCEISEDTKDENTLSLYRQYRKCPWMTKNKTDTVPFGCWTWHLLFHVVLKSKMRHYFWKLMWVFKEIKTILFCFYLVFMYYDSLSSAFLSSSISLLTFSKDFFFFFFKFYFFGWCRVSWKKIMYIMHNSWSYLMGPTEVPKLWKCILKFQFSTEIIFWYELLHYETTQWNQKEHNETNTEGIFLSI